MLRSTKFWWGESRAARQRGRLIVTRRICDLLLASGVLAAAAAEVVHYYASAASRVTLAHKAELATEVARLQRTVDERPAVLDFARGLSRAIEDPSLTSQIQAAATTTSVSLVSLVSVAHATSPKTLAYEEWALTLRGTYSNIKTLLAHLLDAVPDLRVHALKLKRVNASDIEAQVSLVQWLRPLDADRVETKD